MRFSTYLMIRSDADHARKFPQLQLRSLRHDLGAEAARPQRTRDCRAAEVVIPGTIEEFRLLLGRAHHEDPRAHGLRHGGLAEGVCEMAEKKEEMFFPQRPQGRTRMYYNACIARLFFYFIHSPLLRGKVPRTHVSHVIDGRCGSGNLSIWALESIHFSAFSVILFILSN